MHKLYRFDIDLGDPDYAYEVLAYGPVGLDATKIVALLRQMTATLKSRCEAFAADERNAYRLVPRYYGGPIDHRPDIGDIGPIVWAMLRDELPKHGFVVCEPVTTVHVRANDLYNDPGDCISEDIGSAVFLRVRGDSDRVFLNAFFDPVKPSAHEPTVDVHESKS